MKKFLCLLLFLLLPAVSLAQSAPPTVACAPSPVPSVGLSEHSAVTLAQSVLLSRFGFTQEQVDALNVNTTMWSGDNFPVCWLIEFYEGEYTSEGQVISVGIDAVSGDLRGCYLKQDGTMVWVDVDALNGAPTPSPACVILPDARPTPEPASTPEPDDTTPIRRFVEQIFVPAVKEDETTPYFTRAERMDLIDKAENTGIAFTKDWRAEILGDSEPLYKSDVLAMLVNSQTDYAESWPVEPIHWYGDIQVQCGFWTENPYLLPEEGEFTEEQAAAYAKQSLEQSKGVDADWFSGCDIRYSFQYFADDATGAPGGDENRTWWFSFYPVGQPESDAYYVFFSGAGDNLRIVTK